MELWPKPQDVSGRRGSLSVQWPIRVEERGAAAWLSAAANDVMEALTRSRGAVELLRDGGPGEGTPLVVTEMREVKGARPVEKAEGYVLTVGREGIVLAANDRRGALYGAATLAQMLREGEELPFCVVRDWPQCAVRGVHMYLPAWEHFGFFTRFLDFMAAYRYNTLFLEVSGGMEYRSHPEVNRAWAAFCREVAAYDPATDPNRESMGARPSKLHTRGPTAMQVSRFFPKDSTHTELAGGRWLTRAQIRRLIAECERRHIEIVPEVQSLSHSYYLCMAHPEIAERSRAEDPWPDTYCPSNPKSYELLFDLMDEVIAAFKPRMMHIGHDEAYTFRCCPRCRRKSGHDLFAGDVLRIHDFLATRGVRTLMWGDKFMVIEGKNGRKYGGIVRRYRHPRTGKVYVMPPTYKCATRMPAELMIMDWYWSFDPRSAKQFHRHGFEVIYGNFSPFGFTEREQRSRVPYVHGAEVSSWCGVTAYEFGHNRVDLDVLAAAGMLWSGRTPRSGELRDLLARRLPPEVDALGDEPRWLVSGNAVDLGSVDISAQSAPLPGDLAGKVRTGRELTLPFDKGTLKAAVKGGHLAGGIVLSKCGADSSARRCGTAAPGCGSVQINVNDRADRLILVHATTMQGVFHQPTYYSYHRDPAAILTAEVLYADGKRVRFDARYGDDIGQLFGWPNERPWHCHRATPVRCGEATLYAQEWINPRPGKAIRSLELALGPDATDAGAVIVAAIGKVT